MIRLAASAAALLLSAAPALAQSADANRVVHFSRWRSLDAARRFFESPELVEIRAAAGVRAPEFIYLDELERGEL